MSRYSQFDFYQQSPSALDGQEDDEMSVLDDKILDSTAPDLSDPRRPSYDAQDAFSHRNSIWSNYSHPSSDQSRPTSHLGQSVIDSSAPLMPVDGPSAFAEQHQQHHHQQQQPWSVSRTESGSCTPTGYDQYPSEAEGGSTSAAPFSGGAVGPVGSIPMGAVSFRNGMGFAAPGGVAMSPQSSQGWIPAPMDLADAAVQAKTASYRNGSSLTIRRDGVRKKNARFEIPAERTLSNIDALISQSNNEEEIKELKQQKRLLRNRQAALDSRQRKKNYAEDLERTNKKHQQHIEELDDMVSALKKREAQLLHEKGEWLTQQQQVSQYVNGLHLERDEMIRVHTLETAELRRKNNILMQTVEKLEREVKPNLADNHTSGYTGFEGLIDSHSWDEFTLPNGLPMTDPMPQPVSQPQSHPIAQDNDRSEKANESTSDHPFSWNAFYMCLLFGAFIASNSTSLPDRSLPRLSEEYRAESTNVLKAVLASSPPELIHPAKHAAVSTSGGAGPAPTTMIGLEMTHMGPAPTGSSSLDELHDTLVMPTEEQERAQVFTLNADQYNSLTTFEDDGAAFKPQQPSSLQQALATMRHNAARHDAQHMSTSDVHSRSLMWERVPEKVIRDFRRMVQEYGSPVEEKMVNF